MFTNQLNVIFDGPQVSEGVPLSDLAETFNSVQRAVRLMVEYLVTGESTQGRPSEFVRNQSKLMLCGVSSGSFVAELKLSGERERLFGDDLGSKSLDAILSWKPDDDSSLPNQVAQELLGINKNLSLGINTVMLEDYSGKRQVVIPCPSSPNLSSSSARGQEARVRGYLMEVDWANGTARLDSRVGKSIRLRFNTDFHGEIPGMLAQFVKIQGKGNLNKDGEWTSIEVESITNDNDWSKPYTNDFSVNPKVFNTYDGLLIDDPFESDDELREFIQVVHKGRDV